MDEYIKRANAIEAVRHAWAKGLEPVQYLEIIPPADVAPVRHGRWERTAEGAALCTACKRKMNPSQYGYAFCSLCGAKMDGGED